MTRLLFSLLVFVVACGGSVADEGSGVPPDRIQCAGDLPDLADCELTDEDSGFSRHPCGPQWLCPSWPESPFGDPELYFQLVNECEGELARGVVSRETGEVMCLDRIYSRRLEL